MQGFQYWVRAVLAALDLKESMVGINLFFGGFCRLIFTWICVIHFKMGLSAVFMVDSLSIAAMIVCSVVIMEVIKDTKYVGVLEEKEILQVKNDLVNKAC